MLVLASSPSPGTAGIQWTRVKAPRSASSELLARAMERPDLPYPYFTTYVLRERGRTANVECRGDRRPPTADRRRSPPPD